MFYLSSGYSKKCFFCQGIYTGNDNDLSSSHRRVCFPMGSFGSPTLKMTVSPGGNRLHLVKPSPKQFRILASWCLLPSAPVRSTPCVLRLWGTPAKLSSLARPLNIQMLKDALARTLHGHSQWVKSINDRYVYMHLASSLFWRTIEYVEWDICMQPTL